MIPRHVSPETSLRLVQFSTIVTWMTFALPVLSLFYKVEIGMTLAQVGQSQAAYTAAVLLLNVPTGIIADRYSRKACNVAGCFIAALGFGIYTLADSFLLVVISEVIVGIGLSAAEGADGALLEDLAISVGKTFSDVNERTTMLRIGAEVLAVGVGGYFGVAHPRWMLAATAGVMALGGMAALIAHDPGVYQQHEPQAQSRVRDWLRTLPDRLKVLPSNVKIALTTNSLLVWWVIAFGVSQRIPQALIWFFTPLLFAVGASPTWIAVAWMFYLATGLLGAYGAKLLSRLSDVHRYMICVTLFVIPAVALSVSVNTLTVCLYGSFGLMRGWLRATLPPVVQAHAPQNARSSAISAASTIGDLLYIPAVWAIGAASDVGLRWGMLTGLVVYGSCLAGTLFMLSRYEQPHASATLSVQS